MKKIVASIAAVGLLLSGCTQPLVTAEKTYPSYGLLNREKASDKVCYETSTASVILGIVLVETIIAPVYFFGFDLYQPTGMKGAKGCGIDAQ